MKVVTTLQKEKGKEESDAKAVIFSPASSFDRPDLSAVLRGERDITDQPYDAYRVS
jgi:hypothetical protein